MTNFTGLGYRTAVQLLFLVIMAEVCVLVPVLVGFTPWTTSICGYMFVGYLGIIPECIKGNYPFHEKFSFGQMVVGYLVLPAMYLLAWLCAVPLGVREATRQWREEKEQ